MDILLRFNTTPMSYSKESFLLREAEELFAPNIDDLLYLAEIEAIHLYVYPTDLLVLWEGVDQHERINDRLVLPPKAAQALRTNREKQLNKVCKLVDGRIIFGLLYSLDQGRKLNKASYKINVDKVIVTNSEMVKIESEELTDWKELRDRRSKDSNSEGHNLKKGTNKKTATAIVQDLFLLIAQYDDSCVAIHQSQLSQSQSTVSVLKIIKASCETLAKIKPDKFAYKDGKVKMGYRQKAIKGSDASKPVGVVGYLRKYISKLHSVSNLQKYLSQALNIDSIC